MELSLTRQPSTALATLGHLDVDGRPFCHTLEDPVRDLGEHGEGKVYGKTAIPAGRYAVDITWSPKFQKKMLLVKDVPFFTGIRIHGGSVVLPQLFMQVQEALDKGEKVWLTIQDAPQAAG